MTLPETVARARYGRHGGLRVISAFRRPDAITARGSPEVERARAPAMSVPKKRFAEMTALEYFRHAIERAETDETRRRRAASTRAPLPSPPPVGFRREDYCEMSAAWDPATFRKTRKNEARRAVYSLTVVRSPPTA